MGSLLCGYCTVIVRLLCGACEEKIVNKQKYDSKHEKLEDRVSGRNEFLHKCFVYIRFFLYLCS